MGEDLEAKGNVSLTLQVFAPKRIARAVLVRDGSEIHTIPGEGPLSLQANFNDRPEAGFHWYYWRIEQEGSTLEYPGNMKVAEGNLVWSSPHRVQLIH
jgi:hypothetical protein